MKCPRCHRPVDHEADTCYSCEYSAIDAMRRFGSNEVRMKRIHDAADCLRVRENHEISELFDALETRFPQLLFSVYLGELRGIPISELGFWLLDHATISDAGIARTNDCGVLLIVDIADRRMGLSTGYFAERLIDEEASLRILMASRSYFLNNEFGEGVHATFRRVEKHLVKQARKMKKLSRQERQSYLDTAHAEPALETYGLPALLEDFPEEEPAREAVLVPH